MVINVSIRASNADLQSLCLKCSGVFVEACALYIRFSGPATMVEAPTPDAIPGAIPDVVTNSEPVRFLPQPSFGSFGKWFDRCEIQVEFVDPHEVRTQPIRWHNACRGRDLPDTSALKR
jgi:hypothetical protein